MAWCNIRGHDSIVERFRRSLERGRLASSYLFVGPGGIGKRLFALKLAQVLLCQVHPEEKCLPCGHCEACLQVMAGSHPDLELLAKPDDKSFIPVESLIGDREHRMREGLCHRIALKPFCGGRKIAVIDDADFLNAEGANCLLKTLEEPPPKTLLILIGTSEQRQLPTIPSRCQIVRFSPLSAADISDLLLAAGIAHERNQAERWAELSEGSMQQAAEAADAELWEFREQLLRQLGSCERLGPGLAAEVNAFVERAGKDALPRRLRLRKILHQAARFFAGLTRALVAAETAGDPSLRDAVQQALKCGYRDAELASACLERCLVAEDHVDANASLATVIECWLDDLARLSRQRTRRGGAVVN